MRRFLLGIVTFAIVGSIAWADAKTDADVEKLKGVWNVTSIEIKGKTYPAPEEGGSLLFAKDKKMVMKDKGKPDKNGKYEIDAGKNPKELDLIEGKEEDKGGEAIRGIYEIDGDTLRMAFSQQGPKGERPGAFDSEKAVIMTLKRQKK